MLGEALGDHAGGMGAQSRYSVGGLARLPSYASQE